MITVCQDHPTWISVTAPWCGHCMTYKPQEAKLVAMRTHHVLNVSDGVDDDAVKALGVKGFPTLLLYKPQGDNGNGALFEYGGARDAQSISAYMDAASADPGGASGTRHLQGEDVITRTAHTEQRGAALGSPAVPNVPNNTTAWGWAWYVLLILTIVSLVVALFAVIAWSRSRDSK